MKRLGMLLLVAVLLAGFSATAATVKLTMMAVDGQGTTNPASPGVYNYTKNTNAVVTAYPAGGWAFVNWTGSVTSTNNPLTIKMNSNK
ncbi:MAG: hypothetical protein IMZ62_00370, partial [Chloroflexi bacterium]|nr:hypothetical protein [Chloroflexota bacterium]